MKDILDKVSYHAVYDSSIMDVLRYAKVNGFAGVQLAVELPHLSFETATEREYCEIAEFCAANRLYMCLHGPDDVASLFVSKRVREAAQAKIQDSSEHIAKHILWEIQRFGAQPWFPGILDSTWNQGLGAYGEYRLCCP